MIVFETTQDILDRLRAENERLRAEVERLQALVPKKEGVTMALVREVWQEYLSVHEIKKGQPYRGQLSPARQRLIKKAIAVHGVENSKRACAGVFIHPWSAEHNTSIEWALRMNQTTDNVEKHADEVGYVKKSGGPRYPSENQGSLL